MAPMKPLGNSRRRKAHMGTASDGERNGRRRLGRDETPEEAARAIADALDFLEREASKLGVRDACTKIQRASAMMREFAEAGTTDNTGGGLRLRIE